MKPLVLATAIIATLGAASAAAVAQSRMGGVWDASQLPETKGTVKQYTLSPRGDVDGFVLEDGTQVQLPPHLSAQTVFAVKPGDKVTIKGLKARALPLVDAALVTNDATGVEVADRGPPAPSPDHGETVSTGVVASTLHGRKGEMNGVVLQDGSIVRLPPPEAARFADLLRPGATIAVRGPRNVADIGTWIDARAIGSSAERLSELPAPPKPPKGRPDRAPPPPRG